MFKRGGTMQGSVRAVHCASDTSLTRVDHPKHPGGPAPQSLVTKAADLNVFAEPRRPVRGRFIRAARRIARQPTGVLQALEPVHVVREARP
jgi:hypothetical protein